MGSFHFKLNYSTGFYSVEWLSKFESRTLSFHTAMISTKKVVEKLNQISASLYLTMQCCELQLVTCNHNSCHLHKTFHEFN